MTRDKLKEILGKILRGQITETETDLIFNEREITIITSLDDVDTVIANYSHKTYNDTTLIGRTSIEVLISLENSRRAPMYNSQEFAMEDKSNGIRYTVGKASDEYIIFMLEQLFDGNMLNDFRRRFMMMGTIVNDRLRSQEETLNLFEYLRQLFRRIYTLQIESSTSRGIIEFKKLVTSTIFHVAYNLELPFVEIKSWDEYFNLERMHRRRNTPQELDVPKRTYIEDLVYHYQMAISTDSPYLQYISYYHIIEHFMERIYEEELIRLIQFEITSPNFSVKREKDVKRIIKTINNMLKIRKEETVINEREAVRLTIDKYVDVNNLLSNINQFDSDLINYYKNNEVTFSKGRKVDLTSDKRDQIIKDLSERIYDNRNSIVHSKETEKSKYIPFKNDKCLMKEIPLIRAISEEIIIKTSEVF
jgi:hypothetical protein